MSVGDSWNVLLRETPGRRHSTQDLGDKALLLPSAAVSAVVVVGDQRCSGCELEASGLGF